MEKRLRACEKAKGYHCKRLLKLNRFLSQPLTVYRVKHVTLRVIQSINQSTVSDKLHERAGSGVERIGIRSLRFLAGCPNG